jgi:hypothetical protein
MDIGSDQTQSRVYIGTDHLESKIDIGSEQTQSRIDIGSDQLESKIDMGSEESESKIEMGTEGSQSKNCTGSNIRLHPESSLAMATPIYTPVLSQIQTVEISQPRIRVAKLNLTQDKTRNSIEEEIRKLEEDRVQEFIVTKEMMFEQNAKKVASVTVEKPRDQFLDSDRKQCEYKLNTGKMNRVAEKAKIYQVDDVRIKHLKKREQKREKKVAKVKKPKPVIEIRRVEIEEPIHAKLVIKKFQHEYQYLREKEFVKKLKKFKIAPKLFRYSDKRQELHFIAYDDVHPNNIPEDFRDQILRIKDLMKKKHILYKDLNIKRIKIYNGHIVLDDWHQANYVKSRIYRAACRSQLVQIQNMILQLERLINYV